MRYLIPFLIFFLPGCGGKRVSKEEYYDQSETIAELQAKIDELMNIPWWMLVPPETVIQMAATACAAVGALLFALSFLALWFIGRKTFMTMIVIGLALMSASPILAFVSAYLMWIGLVVALGLGYLIWNRIEWIEKLLGIDINGDGFIGRHKKSPPNKDGDPGETSSGSEEGGEVHTHEESHQERNTNYWEHG